MPLEPRIIFNTSASNADNLITALRYQIGDTDLDNFDYQNFELYGYLINSDAMLQARGIGSGLTFYLSKIFAEGSLDRKMLYLLILGAELIIAHAEEREGTNRALKIKEGDTTFDGSALAKHKSGRKSSLYDEFSELIKQYKMGTIAGLRIDTYTMEEYG